MVKPLSNIFGFMRFLREMMILAKNIDMQISCLTTFMTIDFDAFQLSF